MFRKLIRVVAYGLLGLVLLAPLGLIVLANTSPGAIRRALTLAGSAAPLVTPELAAGRDVRKCVWLEQNWSDGDSAWFHNVSQGTATFPMPYAWFRHLEQPEVGLLEPFRKVGLISDPAFLARLGFLAPDEDCDPRHDGEPEPGYGVLPVGFAVLDKGKDPATGDGREAGLGLTCAACHTGRVLYQGTELRIDGGAAMIDLQNLERVIGLSICYTNSERLGPWRRNRFIDALIADDPELAKDPGKAAADIKAQLLATCNTEIKGKVLAEKALLERRKLAHTDEGFGRLDALNRIGNQVFHENLADPEHPDRPLVGVDAGGLSNGEFERNFAPRTAPVSFPPIWDVPHFSWAQYDASILEPGVRNVGEAMGVAARINMTRPDDPALPLFGSTVAVDEIQKIEGMLAGPTPPHGERAFSGLRAPKWADAAKEFPDDEKWSIDPALAGAGREIYLMRCAECHRGAIDDDKLAPDQLASFWNAGNWVQIGQEMLFDVVQKPAADMGTDPEQARVLAERSVAIPKYLGIDTASEVLMPCGFRDDDGLRTSFAAGLMAAVRKVENQWARSKGLPLRDDAQGRGNCPNGRVFRSVSIQSEVADDSGVELAYVAEPVYRARPLDGVWATAPYLHNGSVPTLEDLLKPQAERPKTFCVGPLDFDPEAVGLSRDPTLKPDADLGPGEMPACEAGLTLFDVSVRGNSNLGHSFEGSERRYPQGIIGPGFDDGQRKALIEYLKTL